MYKCNLSFTNAFIWLLSSKPINPMDFAINSFASKNTLKTGKKNYFLSFYKAYDAIRRQQIFY